VRVTVRRTDYAQEWSTADTVSIGLVWRWGRALDVHASRPYPVDVGLKSARISGSHSLTN
jgi:hypothetical protein